MSWAARHGHTDIINLLASEGANVNETNKVSLVFNLIVRCKFAFKSGETALHIATRYVQMDPVQALIAHGADQSIQDEVRLILLYKNRNIQKQLSHSMKQ